MKLEAFGSERRSEASSLFRLTFSAAEGEEEGRLLGELVDRLSAVIDGQEVIAVGAFEDGVLIGALFLTRLRFDDDALVYMLAPVGVSPSYQRTGVGQRLIKVGLQRVKKQGAVVAITYGDPAYYGRVGFEAISERVIRAPMPLSRPHGWLAQSLSGSPIQARQDRPQCVEPFRNSAYW